MARESRHPALGRKHTKKGRAQHITLSPPLSHWAAGRPYTISAPTTATSGAHEPLRTPDSEASDKTGWVRLRQAKKNPERGVRTLGPH